jgi:hypothetical protein
MKRISRQQLEERIATAKAAGLPSMMIETTTTTTVTERITIPLETETQAMVEDPTGDMDVAMKKWRAKRSTLK